MKISFLRGCYRCYVIVSLLFLAGISQAREVAVPMKLEHHLIEQVLLDQVFTGKNHSLRTNDDGTGCNFLELTNPRVDTKNGLIRVRLDTWARIGQAMGDQCLLLLDWHGQTDLYNTVKLAPNGRMITIKVIESQLLDKKGNIDQSTNQVWQWFSKNVYPVMDEATIDLNEPVSEIKSFIPVFVAKQDERAIKTLIDSFEIKTITINPKGLLLNLNFEVPDASASKPAPVPLLTPAEVKLLESKLNALDAFITFTIKQFLTADTPEYIRISLLEILIDLRYEVIDLVARPNTNTPDPVKKLFIDSWQRIAPLIRELAKLPNSQATTLHYVTFITANEVLNTIDQLGPSLGLDVSIDGLRRLARMLNADPSIDPIKPIDDEIPGFQFGASVNAKNTPKPRSDIPLEWLNFFVSTANAKQTLNKKDVEKLNNWVPKNDDMNKYLPMVEQVIAYVTDQQLKKTDLDAKYHKLFRSLVYAAAWQESCWRQYEARKGQRWPLKSYSGDLGMMQINPRVWRGFYSIHKIKWDIVYNANAGAEILLHYLERYALRNNEHKKTGQLDSLARATYAGYNGGPRQYTRYRDKSAPKDIKRIDRAFYKKFQEIYNGNTLAVKSCYAGI